MIQDYIKSKATIRKNTTIMLNHMYYRIKEIAYIYRLVDSEGRGGGAVP